MAGIRLFGERSLTLVAGLFGTLAAADLAVRELQRTSPATAISMVQPGDPALLAKLEPEQGGIFRTALRSHGWLCLAGMLGGLVLALGLFLAGLPLVVFSPGFTVLACVLGGGIAGLLAAGLLTLRPDHGRVIRHVREGSSRGQWAVVAHPTDRAASERVSDCLRAAGANVMRSF